MYVLSHLETPSLWGSRSTSTLQEREGVLGSVQCCFALQSALSGFGGCGAQLVLMQITKQGRWRRAQTHLLDMNAPMMLAEGGARGRKCLVLLGYLNLLEGTPALTNEARYLVQVHFTTPGDGPLCRSSG
jgi:hypothetical protein